MYFTIFFLILLLSLCMLMYCYVYIMFYYSHLSFILYVPIGIIHYNAKYLVMDTYISEIKYLF